MDEERSLIPAEHASRMRELDEGNAARRYPELLSGTAE